MEIKTTKLTGTEYLKKSFESLIKINSWKIDDLQSDIQSNKAQIKSLMEADDDYQIYQFLLNETQHLQENLRESEELIKQNKTYKMLLEKAEEHNEA